MKFKKPSVEYLKLGDDYKSLERFIDAVCISLDFPLSELKDEYSSFTQQFLKEPATFKKGTRDVRDHVWAPIYKVWRKTDKLKGIPASDTFFFNEKEGYTGGMFLLGYHQPKFHIKKFYNLKKVKEILKKDIIPHTFILNCSLSTLLKIATYRDIEGFKISYNIPEEDDVACIIPEWLVGANEGDIYKEEDLTPSRIKEKLEKDEMSGVAVGVASCAICAESIVKQIKDVDVLFNESSKLYPSIVNCDAVITAPYAAWSLFCLYLELHDDLQDTELGYIRKEIEKLLKEEEL